MLLTATVKYLSGLYPVLYLIIPGGITWRIIDKGIKAQSNGLTLEEYFQQVKRLLSALIISVCIEALVAVFQYYYK